MTDPLAIAVSGGIDSLVATHLLKQRGHELFGVHFLTGFEKPENDPSRTVASLGRQLGIAVEVIDLGTSFKRKVVDYFSAAYRSGRTPNPCLVCNPSIKFGDLLDAVRRRGASGLATGHYARVGKDERNRVLLRKGIDGIKDQSYFLARLTPDQLAQAHFPLGTWTKSAVRALAAEAGLMPVHRQESQDVCFIGASQGYADFLVRETGIQPRPGEIVDSSGRELGVHQGLHRFTVGQRRGINCPAGQPYYVLRIEPARNRLVVGFRDELFIRECRVTDVNWINGVPDAPMIVDTRIRYRHRPAASIVSAVGEDAAVVRFEHPQAAVAPGQGAVFYRGDVVIGGGWIE